MEEGDNILDAIYNDDNLDDVDDDDVDMIDIEEGELVEPDSQNVLGQSSATAGDTNEANQESHSKDPKRRANKRKKNKRKRKSSGSKATDINRFVLDTCRHLKEKKSYMVYTAVGCLGISALSDLIKEIFLLDASLLLPILCLSSGYIHWAAEGEANDYRPNHFAHFNVATNHFRAKIGSLNIDAIQACGGQKTADGRRFRTGGGILWNVIKVREPKAYKEIMKRAREFEKQFRQPKQLNLPKKENSSQGVSSSFAGRDQGNFSDSALLESQVQNQHEPATSKENSSSVHDRLRIPVSYDDDLLGENPINGAT